jgi:hypothetical protein
MKRTTHLCYVPETKAVVRIVFAEAGRTLNLLLVAGDWIETYQELKPTMQKCQWPNAKESQFVPTSVKVIRLPWLENQ